MKVAVEFNGPVVAKVKYTFVVNCEEGAWRMYQSGGWSWVTNGKWQQQWVWNFMGYGLKMGSGNNGGCGIGWVSGSQSQWYIYGKLWGKLLENLPEW